MNAHARDEPFGTTDQAPARERPEENRPPSRLSAADDPAEGRGGAGENPVAPDKNDPGGGPVHGAQRSGELPEEDDDDQASDELLPEDDEERAMRGDMSGRGIRYEPE